MARMRGTAAEGNREVVLNYLESAYPPRAPAGRGGWVNPFAK